MTAPNIYGLFKGKRLIDVVTGKDRIWELQAGARSRIKELREPTTIEEVLRLMKLKGYTIHKMKLVPDGDPIEDKRTTYSLHNKADPL